MKSSYYRCTERESGKELHLVSVYDETAPCVLCGLPVVNASQSATGICGWCDNGDYRNGTKKFRDDLHRKLRRENRKLTTQEVWHNQTAYYYFDTRDEAKQKVYDLHTQENIEGWPHFIESVKAKLKERDGLPK